MNTQVISSLLQPLIFGNFKSWVDSVDRLALADYLDECSDPRAERIRNIHLPSSLYAFLLPLPANTPLFTLSMRLKTRSRSSTYSVRHIGLANSGGNQFAFCGGDKVSFWTPRISNHGFTNLVLDHRAKYAIWKSLHVSPLMGSREVVISHRVAPSNLYNTKVDYHGAILSKKTWESSAKREILSLFTNDIPSLPTPIWWSLAGEL